MDDSLHDRTWVDRECCRKFVENIVTAFGTVMPTSQQLNDCCTGGSTASSRPQANPLLNLSDPTGQYFNVPFHVFAVLVSVYDLHLCVLVLYFSHSDRMTKCGEHC